MTPSSSNRFFGGILIRILTRGVAVGVALAGFAGSVLLAQSPGHGRVACLHYEPELVRLSGVLEQTTFQRETAWILRLTEPICTTGPADVNRPERDVREVELIARGSMLARFPDFTGATVTASGTLSHSHTGHHHAAVLLAVKGLVGHGHRESTMIPPTPRGSERPAPKDPMEAVVRELESKLSQASARELAAIQARWQELAERDCRWEVSLSGGSSDAPSRYDACIDRARRDRMQRLESVIP